MQKLTIHIDDQLFEHISNAANKERLSIQKWISNRLKSQVKPGPQFDSTRIFGSVHDIDHDYHYPESSKEDTLS